MLLRHCCSRTLNSQHSLAKLRLVLSGSGKLASYDALEGKGILTAVVLEQLHTSFHAFASTITILQRKQPLGLPLESILVSLFLHFIDILFIL
jgi:hypothetical protein